VNHIDENEFFRQATLRICGNLEVEEAMFSLLQFLSEFMPVDAMVLEYYDHDYNAMRSIALASRNEYKKLDVLTPLTEDARDLAGLGPTEQDVFLIEDPHAFPVSREMLRFFNVQSSSIALVALKAKEQLVGFLILISKGEKHFDKEDLRLLDLLKEPLVIAMSNTLKHREIIKLNALLVDDNRFLHGELHRLSGDEIVGANFGLRDVMYKVRQVATSDSAVLLLGETGVGKDVIANAIHYLSGRSNGPFVSVNCGAIPDTLIDSELFGHEKGAFTGALSQKRGRFERADKGTIFLDEIGELPLAAQVRLLKVLQNKEIERVGGVKTIPLDIRVVAATNRNLEEMVKLNQFREDLWFRLNVFPIWIPPLRERRSDIPTLLQHFISLKSRELKLPAIPTVIPGATERLLEYHWPGNIRELQNVVERELILNPTGPLSFSQLDMSPQNSSGKQTKQLPLTDNLDELTKQHIRHVLKKTNGKIHGKGGAADLLGIHASTLRNRMNKLGIEYRKR